MTINIKYFRLGNPMNQYEDMQIPVTYIPGYIMFQNNLVSLAVNNNILVKIRKGIYKLPHAGLIVQQRLNKYFYQYEYTSAESALGIYTHHARKTTFTLIVDDFGLKYYNTTKALYTINYLKN